MWLAYDYNSGRSFQVEIKGRKWSYRYRNSSMAKFRVSKNGEYFGWLNRKRLYLYLLEKEEVLDKDLQSIRASLADEAEKPHQINRAAPGAVVKTDLTLGQI